MTRDVTALDVGSEIDPLGPFHVELVNLTSGSLTSSITTIATRAMNDAVITCFNSVTGADLSSVVEVDVRTSKWYLYLYICTSSKL